LIAMADGDRRARIRLLVSGRVQGVFFRAAAAAEARALGVTGYACNLPDGTVEIVAEGKRAALNALAAWTRRGPRPARVDEVAIEWSDFCGEFADFTIR